MVTVGLLSMVVLALTGSVLFFLARIWTLEGAFIRVSWIPLAALVLEGIFFKYLTGTLSYFAVAIPVLTCIVSILLAFTGATLVSSSRERDTYRPALLRAAIVASIPGFLLAGFILYSVATH